MCRNQRIHHYYTHTESLNEDGIMTKCAKTDLVGELEDIIRKYNCIPTIRITKSNTIQIDFKYKHHSSKVPFTFYLVIDPNDPNVCDYKKIKTLCSDHNIEFKNQSFSHFITQLQSKHFDTSIKRHKFTI